MKAVKWSVKTWCILAFLAVVLLWVLSWIFIDNIIDDSTKRGAFGDKFGAVNALFSGLAFAGLIVTLIYQHIELGLQRAELKDQNKTAQYQRFENTLFHMLDIHQTIVNDLELVHKDSSIHYEMDSEGKHYSIPSQLEKKYHGREVFQALFNSEKVGETMYPGEKYYLRINGIGYYSESGLPSLLDHYFRNLYTLFKFIDNEPSINAEEKHKYSNIARATLSRYELVWLYYNGLSDAGRQFKPLIEKYSILNNIRTELLTLSKENKDCYENKGYKLYPFDGYSGTDYEFFMTDGTDTSKYTISAFYSANDYDEGTKFYAGWESIYNKMLMQQL